jgi:hypothetical protein
VWGGRARGVALPQRPPRFYFARLLGAHSHSSVPDTPGKQSSH